MAAENKNTNVTVAQDSVEDTIDLLELANVLLEKAWLLILGLVIGACIAGIFTALAITPKYEASSMVYISSKSTSITSLADLQVGSQLAVDFQIVATTREVIDNVIDKLDLDTTYDSMLKTVNISNPSGSHILKVTVTNPDPELAAEISNALADELRARIADVMNTDEPSIVERAYVPSKPASPSIKKNAAIGGLGVAVVIAAVIVVLHLMDDTIKNEDDVKKYLGLNVLAEIPVERAQKKGRKQD